MPTEEVLEWPDYLQINRGKCMVEAHTKIPERGVTMEEVSRSDWVRGIVAVELRAFAVVAGSWWHLHQEIRPLVPPFPIRLPGSFPPSMNKQTAGTSLGRLCGDRVC